MGWDGENGDFPESFALGQHQYQLITRVQPRQFHAAKFAERLVMVCRGGEYDPYACLAWHSFTADGRSGNWNWYGANEYPEDQFEQLSAHGVALYRKLQAWELALLPANSDLHRYYTGREEMRQALRTAAAAPVDEPVPALYLQGGKGVGKTSALLMLSRDAVGQEAAFALASGDSENSVHSLLTAWARGLKKCQVPLQGFSEISDVYAYIYNGARQILIVLAKVLPKMLPLPEFSDAIKLLLGELLGLLTTVVLRERTPAERRMAEKGAEERTTGFLKDLGESRRRILLILDDADRATGLSNYLRSLIGQLPPNVTLVFSGSSHPDWLEGRPNAKILPLAPLTDGEIGQMLSVYSRLLLRRELTPDETRQIAGVAGGVPGVAVRTANRYVEGQANDIGDAKTDAVRELARAIRDSVPDELRPVLDAAATLRWIDQPSLAALVGKQSAEKHYASLRRLPIVWENPTLGRLMLQDRSLLHDDLQTREPVRWKELHTKAAAYFKEHADSVAGTDAWVCDIEAIYHATCANEQTGMKMFQDKAEAAVRYWLLDHLDGLLESASAFPFHSAAALNWVRYYRLRLGQLRGRPAGETEAGLQELVGEKHSSVKLKAYALCDLGILLSRADRLAEDGGVRRALGAMEESLKLRPKVDAKLVHNYINRIYPYQFENRWADALETLQTARQRLEELQDFYELIAVDRNAKAIYAKMGDWPHMIEAQERGLDQLPDRQHIGPQGARVLANWALGNAWAGRYFEAEQDLRRAVEVLERNSEPLFPGLFWDMGLAVGLQGRFAEAHQILDKALEMARVQKRGAYAEAVVAGYRGRVLLQQRDLLSAYEHLDRSIRIRREQLRSDGGGLQEVELWLAEQFMLRRDFADAARVYRQAVETWPSLGRQYCLSAARTGLARLHTAQRMPEALAAVAAAMEPAEHAEYNDHLALLWRCRGHAAMYALAAEGTAALDRAEQAYRKSLVHALRYNRFLLDEILGEWPDGDPPPEADPAILPLCRECGDAGRELVERLRQWWLDGLNDTGVARKHTISRVAAGIPLQMAERLARRNEPGDGGEQRLVRDRLTLPTAIRTAGR